MVKKKKEPPEERLGLWMDADDWILIRDALVKLSESDSQEIVSKGIQHINAHIAGGGRPYESGEMLRVEGKVDSWNRLKEVIGEIDMKAEMTLETAILRARRTVEQQINLG